jgi:hypothetical protein
MSTDVRSNNTDRTQQFRSKSLGILRLNERRKTSVSRNSKKHGFIFGKIRTQSKNSKAKVSA